MIKIGSSPKGYTQEADKAVTPEETAEKVTQAFTRHGQAILKEVRRIDTGRLDIPVYFSYYGVKAREMGVPKRQQMGKGASPVQAKCSALMELAERYSFFSFAANSDHFTCLSWKEASSRWGERLLPVSEVIKSVQEDISEKKAREALNLLQWRFTPALNVYTGREEYVPLDWFKKLNEFNGSSAGNTFEESILQGACELVERHVSALVDRQHPETPTINQENIASPVLRDLLNRFARHDIQVWLKDFSLGYPVPTVGALAYDPGTFPGLSEIVFTAGTATSPEMAAIRALTEVAQLAGDFHSGSNYEASGLPKFASLNEARWLTRGPNMDIDRLPDISRPDMGRELMELSRGLKLMGYNLYTVSTKHPDLEVPTNYSFVPGFLFRERTPGASIGMFVGRILAEEEEPFTAAQKLAELSRIYPGASFLPFYQGMNLLRQKAHEQAADYFAKAETLQPDRESRALSAFYFAYTLSCMDKWPETIEPLTRAIELDPQVKEYFNLRGVAYFKQKDYEPAINEFQKALQLDSGSIMDMFNLAVCYKELGRKQAAFDMLQKVLETEPGHTKARKYLEEIEA
ncbi:YcaO-like family protein [Desulfonatronospira sp.]|uniref:YcaO-like family protein n=1 Tax=Desulfonatronospira sp. TaxID=1962951 RepID=UPI0025BBD402|nr:YcaO-like family protein [Desulfonatronospira sp.]